MANRNEFPSQSLGRNPRPNTSRLQPGIHRYPRDTDHAHVYLFFRYSSLSLPCSSVSVLLLLFSAPRTYLFIHPFQYLRLIVENFLCTQVEICFQTFGYISLHRYRIFVSIRKKVPRYRNIHVCYARRLSVSQSAPLESLSPSLALSCLLFLPLAFSLFAEISGGPTQGSGRQIRGGCETRNGFPFHLGRDSIRLASLR